MLIIGHRGSAGTKPENSIAGIREAIRAGADMVEFDIRVTKDGHPVLAHDFHMFRTYRKFDFISRHTLAELQKLTAGSEMPIVTLEQAMKQCFGLIFVNIEIKKLSAVIPVLEVVSKFCKRRGEWETVMFSSFFPLVLRRLRTNAKYAQLALLHHINPFDFVVWHRRLELSAVGFHRLRVDPLALEIARRLGIFTYAYTVNRVSAARRLAQKGVDGIVTNYPAQMVKEVSDS